jgi:hypothetical protein
VAKEKPQSFAGTADEWQATMADHAPASRPYTLSSGRVVIFEQPDLFDLASGRIDIPNAAKRDIWELLLRYQETANPNEQLIADERWIRAHFYAAQLVIRPRVKLDDDDKEAVIDRKELSLPDLLAVYAFLRFGPAPHTTPEDREYRADQAPAPLSDGVSPEPE